MLSPTQGHLGHFHLQLRCARSRGVVMWRGGTSGGISWFAMRGGSMVACYHQGGRGSGGVGCVGCATLPSTHQGREGN